MIATCNDDSLIEERVNNLLSQDYPHDRLEIIVVSDGSVDSTDSILERMARENRQLHILLIPENRGKAEALNQGLEDGWGNRGLCGWASVFQGRRARPTGGKFL